MRAEAEYKEAKGKLERLTDPALGLKIAHLTVSHRSPGDEAEWSLALVRADGHQAGGIDCFVYDPPGGMRATEVNYSPWWWPDGAEYPQDLVGTGDLDEALIVLASAPSRLAVEKALAPEPEPKAWSPPPRSHTPGPWGLEDETGYTPHAATDVFAFGGRLVANCGGLRSYPDNGTRQQNRINASYIAQLPRALATLELAEKEITDFLEAMAANEQNPPLPLRLSIMGSVQQQIREFLDYLAYGQD